MRKGKQTDFLLISLKQKLFQLRSGTTFTQVILVFNNSITFFALARLNFGFIVVRISHFDLLYCTNSYSLAVENEGGKHNGTRNLM